MSVQVRPVQIYEVTTVAQRAERMFSQIESALVLAPFLRNNNHSLSAVAPDQITKEGVSTLAFA